MRRGRAPLALVGLSDLKGRAFGDVAGELSDRERTALAAALGLTALDQPARDALEAHLTRIYRKLGIRSRTELARVMLDGRLSFDEE